MFPEAPVSFTLLATQGSDFGQTVLKMRSDYGFAESDHLYMIPQSVFKFHPMYDQVIFKLLKADPLVFRSHY